MFYPVFAAIDVRKIAIKRRTSSISTHKTTDLCMNSVDDRLPSARWKIHLLKKYAANDWLNILLNFSRPTTCNAISRKKKFTESSIHNKNFLPMTMSNWKMLIKRRISNFSEKRISAHFYGIHKWHALSRDILSAKIYDWGDFCLINNNNKSPP